MNAAIPAQSTGALETAALVRSGRLPAGEVVEDALAAIARFDGLLNCFTTVVAESARARAKAVDRTIQNGGDPGPLAGVPFAVKNLFDIAGVTTTAGSRIHADAPPAREDATAVARLTAAGAVLLGALNMDEYAYGFTTENAHYGTTRNPHDVGRVAGGSSGGSAAAVAAGLVPLTLGSDTNGSIRVPAAFCGVFGLKPTYGRISRAGAFPFAGSLDHVGPFARSAADLAAGFDVMHGPDSRDPVCSQRPASTVSADLALGIDGLRLAVAGDYFARQGYPEVFEVVAVAAAALGITRDVVIPEAARARAAAYVITACEGGRLHLDNLKSRPHDFDPKTVERLIAGALLPASWYTQAQRFRSWFRAQVHALFETVDVILAPATPCPATAIGQEEFTLDGVTLPSRPNIGLFTQPLSFIGLPIVCVPVQRPGRLPLGIQVIAAPYQEAKALRVAHALERLGI
ncbi:MAG: AtzE family amidohydrolase, partial [Acidobacteriota bacterium]